MTKTLCIYHGNCADGFGAAWVVRQAIPDAEFHAGVYQEPPPDVTDRDVILVDFSYKRPVLEEMARAARSIIVIDHHKSAAEDLADFVIHATGGGLVTDLIARNMLEYSQSVGDIPIVAHFDMEHSGAMLAWQFFFPDEEPPEALQVIEDRDLWRFDREDTRNVMANIFSYPYDFEVWDRLMREDVDQLQADGIAIERKHHKDITELLSVTTRHMEIGGHRVPVANLPYTMSSDAGHILAEGNAFAACYWDTPEGRVFSLRSTDDGIDVSEVAKAYGGGGHKRAAGFRVTFDHPFCS